MFAKNRHFLGRERKDSTDGTNNKHIIAIDWKRDPMMRTKSWGEFVELLSKDDVWDMVEQGKFYAKIMEEQGEFACLTKISK